MGVSFAIPIDVAMDVSNQLKSGGKVSRGWLGVVIQEGEHGLWPRSFGLEKPAGALVAQIQDDGPAAKGGLQVGDFDPEHEWPADHHVRRSAALWWAL